MWSTSRTMPPRRSASRRKYFIQQTLDRHPVSVTRHRIGTALFLLMLVGMAGYFVSTRDAAIRRRAIAYLRDITSGDVEVGRARFTMFGGIRLYDVHVSTPFDERIDASAVDPAAREIFSAGSVTLEHSPWRLLLGVLRIDRIIATSPTITLVHNVDTDARNWRLLIGEGGGGPPAAPAHRPNMTIRNAKVVLVSVDAQGRHAATSLELDADVRPHPQLESAYCIDVRRLSDPAERVPVIVSPDDRLLTNAPFVDVKTLGMQLPKAYQQLFGRINLTGDVKLSRLSYASDSTTRDDAIELRNVSCSLPMAALRAVPSGLVDSGGDSGTPVSDVDASILTMTGVNGTLHRLGDGLHLDVSGRINDAACDVSGTLSKIDGALRDLGVDIEFTCTGLPAPEGDLRAMVMAEDQIPEGLRRFLADYDPHGKFDIRGRLARQQGAEGRTTFKGELSPQDASATYRGFPLRLDGLRGVVRVEPDSVSLDGLSGRHGSGMVQFTGRIQHSGWWSDVDLDFKAQSLPLDHELFAALSPPYQALWTRFNPGGAADLRLHLRRPGSAQPDSPPPWQPSISADLREATLHFADFPYTLTNVGGAIHIDGGAVEFTALTGRHGSGTVQLDGHARLSAESRPELAIQVAARDVEIDDSVLAALPARAADAVRAFQPGGRFDCRGSVSIGAAVDYDLHIGVSKGKLRPVQFPLPIEDVSANVHVRPDTIDIGEFQGRHGEASLTGRADVQLGPDRFTADATMACAGLLLKPDLYECLPLSVRGFWDQIDPSGSADTRVRLHCETGPDGPVWRFISDLDVKDARICLRAFPIVLTSVQAKARISNERLEITSFHARTQAGRALRTLTSDSPAASPSAGDPNRVAGGEIDLSGKIDFSSGGMEGMIGLDARNFPLTAETVQSLPQVLREAVQTARPVGGLDVHLDSLEFATDAAGKRTWNFDGELRLANLDADLGAEFRRVSGVIRGHGALDASGAVSLDATTDLQRLRLSGWRFQNVRAHLARATGERRLSFEDAWADAYGGRSNGSGEIDFRDDGVDYRASVTVRDAQLADLMATFPLGARPEKKTGKPVKGTLHGNVFLTGKSGPQAYMNGGGELFVRDAQVWKAPLVLAIFQVLNLSPDENAFHDGYVEFYLTRDTLTLHKIDLQGSGMSFVGGGRLQLATGGLDVRLLAGSPARLHVPLLTDLLEGATRDLREVQVSGTLTDPVITPMTLKNLHDALQTLFPEQPQRQAARDERP